MNKPTTPTDLARSRMNQVPDLPPPQKCGIDAGMLITALYIALASAQDLLGEMPAELTDDHQEIGDAITEALGMADEFIDHQIRSA